MTSPAIIIISAPSGTGKSSVIRLLIDIPQLHLSFSISATSRPPRGEEKEGIHYYFLTPEEFMSRIDAEDFIEFVEVYPGRYYGTLKDELKRVAQEGKNLLLDIDVEGALKVKEQYPSDTLTIFLSPPSLPVLRERLSLRGTETDEVIEQRLQRASYELSFAPQFDHHFINDNLQACSQKVQEAITHFLQGRQER